MKLPDLILVDGRCHDQQNHRGGHFALVSDFRKIPHDKWLVMLDNHYQGFPRLSVEPTSLFSRVLDGSMPFQTVLYGLENRSVKLVSAWEASVGHIFCVAFLAFGYLTGQCKNKALKSALRRSVFRRDRGFATFQSQRRASPEASALV